MGLPMAASRTGPTAADRLPVETVTVLHVIKAARRLGFTLDEVADLLEVGRHRHRGSRGGAGLQAGTRARAKLAVAEQRTADLIAIRDDRMRSGGPADRLWRGGR